jgi:hypothetical protein
VPIDDFFAALEETLRQLSPVGRRLGRDDEEQLGGYCIVLAYLEELARAGQWAAKRSPLFIQAPKTVSTLLALAQSHWRDDLCTLSWMAHDRLGEFFSHPAVLNPVFEGSHDVGGADADLIVDDCLIDLKATIDPKPSADALYQLLGYVLLDYQDEHQIRSVGVYLARQGVLLRWRLDDLLIALTGIHPVPAIGELRAEFQDLPTIRKARELRKLADSRQSVEEIEYHVDEGSK